VYLRLPSLDISIPQHHVPDRSSRSIFAQSSPMDPLRSPHLSRLPSPPAFLDLPSRGTLSFGFLPPTCSTLVFFSSASKKRPTPLPSRSVCLFSFEISDNDKNYQSFLSPPLTPRKILPRLILLPQAGLIGYSSPQSQSIIP